ncbi:MAG: RNA pyrophosphohydrolase [Alphaproteobacteria bacterium]|nr:RNA pyrophosphohydrolase [Alphaproteobacteria bacterium]
MEKQYRRNVGIVIRNKDGLVFFARRNDVKNDERCWQFPQGGIEDGEENLAAAYREMFEETGIKSAKLVAEMPNYVQYDFAKGYVWKDKRKDVIWVGQRQKWFLFDFVGDESEINLINPDEQEFCEYKWVKLENVMDKVVEFKHDVYRQVLDFLKDYCL